MSKGNSLRAIYFNGLGSGAIRKREKLAIRYLAKRGIEVEHISINWRSGESFSSLLDRMITITQEHLKKHGRLLLVGSSAGGSLAVNILGKLHDKNLSVVTLCSRLHEASLPWWDYRSLKRMAYIGTPHASQSFLDSVVYCGNITIPNLTKQDKERMVIVRQWADDVVPKKTMDILEVKTYKVPAFGHGWGIAMGVRQLPYIINYILHSL
jgi:hypothetical protein